MFKKFYSLFFVSLSLGTVIFYNPSVSDTYILPCDTDVITSEFGYRNLLGSNNFHNGLDFGASKGSTVYAISSGTIVHNGFLNGYGISIIILHSSGHRSLYGHLAEEQVVALGDYIKQGDTIAFVGPKYLADGRLNGFTTGPHLHLTIFDSNSQVINPRDLNFKENVLN